MGTDNGSKGGKMAANGLPDMSPEEKSGPSVVKTGATCLTLGVVGAGLSLGLIKSGLVLAPSQAKLDALFSNDLQFVYTAAIILGRLVSFLNFFPMGYKEMILRRSSGNLRANMSFFKPLNETTATTYIGLEDEGDVGKYNRANRSLAHFTENSIPFTGLMLLAGFAFPKATVALTGLFAAGRVMHQTGYSDGGYGSHALGFGLATLATGMLEGLVALVALKGMGLPCGF